MVVSVAMLAFVTLFPARVQSRSDPAPPSFEEIIYNLKAANTGLNSFAADQVIDVRVWFLRFRVLTTVYAVRPARYRIVVKDAPFARVSWRGTGRKAHRVGVREVLVSVLPQEGPGVVFEICVGVDHGQVGSQLEPFQ